MNSERLSELGFDQVLPAVKGGYLLGIVQSFTVKSLEGFSSIYLYLALEQGKYLPVRVFLALGRVISVKSIARLFTVSIEGISSGFTCQ